MLEEYNSLRQEKEEKHRQRLEKKKMQSQVAVEQQNLLSIRIRPGTRARCIPSRSLDRSLGNTTPFEKRISTHQQRSSSIKSDSKST
ncbi:hypothetical protein Dimus_031764 [Dionaea muscipula]